MSNFSDTLRSEPTKILSKEPSQALSLVKSYLDDVLSLYKESGSSAKPELSEIITDGLDANQVWWQAKMVIDNVGGELLEKIYDLKSEVHHDDEEEDNGSSSEEDVLEHESQESGSSEDDSDQVSQNKGSENEENEEDDEKDEKNAGKLQEIERYNDNDRSNEPVDTSPDEDKGKLEEKEIYKESDGGNVSSSEESSNEADYSKPEKKSLNDEFFNIDEFNRQTLEAEEGNSNEEEDDEIDYFGDLPSEDDEEALYYNDFFDEPSSGNHAKKKANNENPKKQQEKHDFTEEDYDAAVDSAKLDLFADDDEKPDGTDENTGSEKALSTFEKQQLNIQRQIQQLEKEAVAEKKWALKGEAQSKDRPQDALLEEDVEFDRTSKPVPVITTEVTESLEDMIRGRIKDKKFDDLPRRVMTGSDQKSYKPEFQLSDQKSSKSLAEIYEDDYKGVAEDTVVNEELEKEHDEISEMFNSLFYKLDALSSAHFIPKPSKKSLEVRVETPAVSMEETQPLTMSTEQSLAPQEIYRVGKGENPNEVKLKNGMPVAKEELTRDDKQRLRRAMKRRKANSNRGEQEKKRSKKDATISTLSSAKNVTVIDKKGEKHDVRGNVKGTKGTDNINKIKL